MIETVVKVGIAEMKIVRSPDKIRTSGLGSCVGLVIYDPNAKIAGLVHIMLPDSSLSKNQSGINEAKFANTAIKKLVYELQANGAKQQDLKAKMAGGAQMFHFTSQNEQMRIGLRNVEAVKEQLVIFKIPLLAENTGGNKGRTIEFNTETFKMEIKTVYHDTIYI